MSEPTNTPTRGEMAALSGVTAQLTAKHIDPFKNEGVHRHTWTVTAFYPSFPFRDGRVVMRDLKMELDRLPSDGVLPYDLWSGEAIAARIMSSLDGCVSVRVTRPEGFESWIWK